MSFDLLFKYGKHPKAGRLTPRLVTNASKAEQVYSSTTEVPRRGHIKGNYASNRRVRLKFARMNTPEVFSAFYPAGGFTIGGVVAGIGRGFALNGTYAISNKSNTDPFYVSLNTDPYPTGENWDKGLQPNRDDWSDSFK